MGRPRKAKTVEIPEAREVLAEACRRRFSLFVKTFWNVLEPSNPFYPAFYVDAICDHLQELFRLKRLAINCFPRSGKSLIASVMFPAYAWVAIDPSLKFLCCSYSLKLSTDQHIKFRRLIESPEFQTLYPEIRLQPDNNTIVKSENTLRGIRHALATEGSVIGFGADVIVFDDPNNVNEVSSKNERDKVVNFWRETLSSRVNYRPGKTARLIIQHRCHCEDLCGVIYENDIDNDWTKLVLPFEYAPERHCKTSLPWSDPRKEAGEVLTQRVPPDEISYIRNEKGRLAWESLYNQNPRPQSGEHFKAAFFRYFDDLGHSYKLGDKLYRKGDTWRFGVADLAVSQRNSADWTVIQSWAVTPDYDLILFDQYRERLPSYKLIQAMAEPYQRHSLAFMAIESTAFQQVVLDQARAEGITVKAIVPQGDKVARSFPAQIRFESGQIWFPRDKKWVTGLEEELLGFPGLQWDDQCDALCWACLIVGKMGGLRSERPAAAVPTESDEQRLSREYNAALLEGLF